MFLRDKSVSCSHGLELAQRPTTVIGKQHNLESSKRFVKYDDAIYKVWDKIEVRI